MSLVTGLAEECLEGFLKDHEQDIYHDINDYGRLHNVFLDAFGRPPKREEKDFQEWLNENDLSFSVRAHFNREGNFWAASIENAEILEGSMLSGAIGRHETEPKKAICYYVSRIAGRTLVIDPRTPSRRGIQVPKNLGCKLEEDQ